MIVVTEVNQLKLTSRTITLYFCCCKANYFNCQYVTFIVKIAIYNIRWLRGYQDKYLYVFVLSIYQEINIS